MPKPSAASALDSSVELSQETDSRSAGGGGCGENGGVLLGKDRVQGKIEKVEVKVEGGEEVVGADSSHEEDDDTSKKHKDCYEEPKSIYSNYERYYVSPANSHVNYVRGGNLGNIPPSKSYIVKASEMSSGNVSENTPQRRPRSSSPATEYESANKRPEIICSFFVKGWCIRGNSCRFLHIKEGVGYASMATKEENRTSEDSIELKGPDMVEKSSVSTSIDFIGKGNLENSRNPQFQRALVRTYGGGETHGLFQSKDDDNNLKSKNFSEEHLQRDVSFSSRMSSLAVDELRQKSLFQERNPRTYGFTPHVDSIHDRRSASVEIPSRQYSNEGMMYKAMPRGEPWNESSFSREVSFTKNSLTLGHSSASGGPSTITNIYKDSSHMYSYDKRPDNLARQYQQSHFMLHDSYSSCMRSSIKSSFGFPLHSFRGSPSLGPLSPFAQAGTTSVSGSPPVSAENEDIHTILNYSRGFCSATSGKQSTGGDSLSLSDETKKLLEYTWENSVPFRPSFCCEPFIKSSTGSQYDPLVDRVDHSKEGTTTSASPSAIVEGMLNQHTVCGSILAGDCTPGCHAKNSVNSITPAGEGLLVTKESPHEYCGHTTTAVSLDPSTIERGINFTTEEEKSQIPDLPDAAHVNKTELGMNVSEIDKGKDMEAKVVKNFHAALVDFVKELLKPSWKEGLLSKDVHKLIVKKVVEKVLSSLQPHQVPSGAESIGQYLSLSRLKISKLVEAYVEKYIKS
ncbi:hypothetical protein Cni_G19178 [Canna indica]|uniref:C3H1-type domain-containing protein n=1 Tax=Canna indica TaxID=4628 RepID=A0AAQ3QIE5_9LILI|nr:hypothetical protein Cni_G19178 [Canna indica]